MMRSHVLLLALGCCLAACSRSPSSLVSPESVESAVTTIEDFSDLDLTATGDLDWMAFGGSGIKVQKGDGLLIQSMAYDAHSKLNCSSGGAGVRWSYTDGDRNSSTANSSFKIRADSDEGGVYQKSSFTITCDPSPELGVLYLTGNSEDTTLLIEVLDENGGYIAQDELPQIRSQGWCYQLKFLEPIARSFSISVRPIDVKEGKAYPSYGIGSLTLSKDSEKANGLSADAAILRKMTKINVKELAYTAGQQTDARGSAKAMVEGLASIFKSGSFKDYSAELLPNLAVYKGWKRIMSPTLPPDQYIYVYGEMIEDSIESFYLARAKAIKAGMDLASVTLSSVEIEQTGVTILGGIPAQTYILELKSNHRLYSFRVSNVLPQRYYMNEGDEKLHTAYFLFGDITFIKSTQRR